jgi:hypothetical protein
MGKVPVIGGPLDGIGRVRGRTRFAYISRWGRVFTEPSVNLHLYVLTADGYVYAGDAYARCSCGGWMRKPEGGQERAPCALCGAMGARSA